MKTRYMVSLFAILFLFILNGCQDNDAPALIVNSVEFGDVETTETDDLRTLKSLKREGDLYMITYYGDYNSLLEELNEIIINEGIDSVVPGSDAGYECSIFSAIGDPLNPIFGRNFDNNVERGVLAGLYSPPDGYRSVALSRMSDMGFDRDEDPTLLPVEDRRLLLNSVFFPTDGINERGVSIALATGMTVTLNRDENKKLIFITYLLREVLDHSGTVEEAVNMVRNHDVFDVDTSRISNHLLIAGPDGSSVIAEYYGGEWKFIYDSRPWQIVTNILLFKVTEEERRNECWRYRTADDFLQEADGRINWENGMSILESISVSDTQWSSLFHMRSKEIYISLYGNFDDVYLVSIQ